MQLDKLELDIIMLKYVQIDCIIIFLQALSSQNIHCINIFPAISMQILWAPIMNIQMK